MTNEIARRDFMNGIAAAFDQVHRAVAELTAWR
jgi:hypothetical protein